ncbi:MAG: hypothetical protein PHG00_10875 [Methylococcales bacterium]|nr:hypothetical protein [Methylococcales bacterium]
MTKNYHFPHIDEICRFSNEIPVNPTATYKTVHLCADKPIGVDLKARYTIEALFKARTPGKFAANQNPAGQHATVNGVIQACGYLLSKLASIITCIDLPVTTGVLI